MTHTTRHRSYTITTTRHAVRSWDIRIEPASAPFTATSWLDRPTLGDCYHLALTCGVSWNDLQKHTTSREKATAKGEIEP